MRLQEKRETAKAAERGGPRAGHRQKPREALLRLALRFSAALRLAVPCCAAFQSPRSGSAPQAFAALGATRMLPASPWVWVGGLGR